MRDARLAAVASLLGLVMSIGSAGAQELEPRAFSPSPVGTTFVLGGLGRSEGGILFDPALDIDNVQADLWIATAGAGPTFRTDRRSRPDLGAICSCTAPNRRRRCSHRRPSLGPVHRTAARQPRIQPLGGEAGDRPVPYRRSLDTRRVRGCVAVQHQSFLLSRTCNQAAGRGRGPPGSRELLATTAIVARRQPHGSRAARHASVAC